MHDGAQHGPGKYQQRPAAAKRQAATKLSQVGQLATSIVFICDIDVQVLVLEGLDLEPVAADFPKENLSAHARDN